MPYQNVPDDLQGEMESCVQSVMEKGTDKEGAIAICYASVVEGKSLDLAIEEHHLKIGARNNATDKQRIQAAHDTMVDLGAQCKETEEVVWLPLQTMEDVVITGGGEIKRLDSGNIGGYLVRFTDDNNPDLVADYFTPDTDFDIAEWPHHSTVYYNHGLDSKLKRRKIGKAKLTQDEYGIWAEMQIAARDRYEEYILELASSGKLGWSSGTAAHLVEREPVGKSNRITKWPLGLDASLTPTPAEPRNIVISLKSLLPQIPEAGEAVEVETVTAQRDESVSTERINEMELTEEKLTEMLSAAAEQGAEKALKSLPPVTPDAGIVIVHDEADNPFKSIAEQCAAVKSFEMSKGRKSDPRLSRLDELKATGASEGVASEGGFLLEPTLAAQILMPMHEVGPFTSAAQKMPVGSNSNYGWINGVDETDRATGSRWGGIRGYRLNEGGTKGGSKPAFRRINWELKKYAVLVYGTDELLQDVSQFDAIVQRGAGEELAFMANDDILNGTGLGGPLGILQSGALISQDAETSQVAATIVVENLSKMWSRLDARSKPKAVWYINTDVNPQLDFLALAVGTAALEPRVVTYGPDGVMRIKGRPVIETEFNATLGTVGDIVLADMSQYLYWEKGGVQAASSIHVQFVTDETVFRFVYRCDGQPAIASPLTPYKGTATVGPFVALATRS